jgi:5'-nucleotidase
MSENGKPSDMNGQRPLILFTNDDGIESPGLWAMVNAFKGFADRLVVAPKVQQSATGRSLPNTSKGTLHPVEVAEGEDWVAYGVDGTPAQAVQHGILELSSRLPAMVISGCNYGDNTGNGVTISGTVGAAIEAASFGIPSMAISQQTPHDLHLSYSTEVDFSPAGHFARKLGEWLLQDERPDDVDLLKVDVPWHATNETEWRITRLSRRRVYWPTRPERVSRHDTGRLGYKLDNDPAKAEPDSDVYVLMHKKMVSVTPMSLDMTSRTDMFRLRQLITGEIEYGKRHRVSVIK